MAVKRGSWKVRTSCFSLVADILMYWCAFPTNVYLLIFLGLSLFSLLGVNCVLMY